MRKLDGRVAIVTGAASGLGYAIARRFIDEGARVMLTDIDQAGSEKAASLGLNARFARHDVSSDDQWQAVMQATLAAFGQVDILVNNAGVTLMGSVEDVPLDAFDTTFNINVRGVFLGCRHAIRVMKPRKAGVLINMSSVSSFKAMPELVSYNASKGAVAMMTKSIALHCARNGYGIRCNSINPGMVRTAILDKVMAQVPNPQELMAQYNALHPIGRIGQPDEIASMAVYLASEDASFITGAAFTVDGGLGL
jgi:NAD(P)-dependent dehydrogenase (short-subunit alcohol dehydrogenase family)